ncbi:thiamine ABC transporter substrate binding subunit [Salmonella enterica subsp. enterica serovar Enteritidis]|nr:thiamine ABC transporter substrate binding subunit [Salmonella enterica subsp. enterica serovar Enteritidis]EBX4816930.1 thiamine ABC transporter substrate binding subunit [Salmonella enterica subsp. enterica serovar Newport]ECI7686006.1 thiamine ABC transporter substrate binding subunit [Salmonella enterica subsp. enterica serovar Paratyphi A]
MEAQLRWKLSTLIAALAVSFAPVAQAADTLTIYTYESFTAEWGPGPKVEKAFEAQCNCDVNFVAVSDGVALLNRVKLEGEAVKADIVLGLDNNTMAEAKATNLFVPHGPTGELIVPNHWRDDIFVPYDYGYFAVIYDSERMQKPPRSMKELVQGNPLEKIIIQDPRLSTPGLGLVLWMKTVFGDKSADAWKMLKGRVLTVAPGWSESYAMFMKGEAPMVLSYTTSPAYHMINDKTERYKAAPFEEGQYMQVELAGVTINGAKNPLSEKFIEFMTSPTFQEIIPETNWMLPAARIDKPLNPAFNKLIQPSKTLMIHPNLVAKYRKAWVDEWLSIMSE